MKYKVNVTVIDTTLKKTLIAMFSLCMLAPITPQFYAPIWSNRVLAAQMEQAHGMDYLVFVNKTHKLPDDYEAKVPIVTVKNSLGREFQIERDTYAHFVRLREALLKQGIQIELDSTYRSVYRQQEIVEEFSEKYAEDDVRQDVAKEITRRGVTFEEYMTEVIPYPEGLDTASSGASSAPKEINHAPSCYFSENDYFTMESTKTRTMLTHYPTYQQTTEYTCGPAAALTVLAYYGNREYNEMSLAKAMKTDNTVGTDLLSMVKFFKGIGWQVETGFGSMPFATYDAFREFARDSLKKGNPILVENVDWGGHWRVIIGYDTMGTESPLDDILILMDPYDTCDHKQDGYVVENGEKFYSMWFDHSLLPRNQRNQPWLIARPGR